MENTSEFQTRKEKIIPINSDSALKHDIIKEKMLEGKGMANDTYSNLKLKLKTCILKTK